MSLLWGYDARKCDGEYCPNNCDNCYKAEIEADGFITRPAAFAIERVSAKKAKPAEECLYPKCEECDEYHGRYCTVPMVISKQIFHIASEKLREMDKRLTALETLVTDEILGEK